MILDSAHFSEWVLASVLSKIYLSFQDFFLKDLSLGQLIQLNHAMELLGAIRLLLEQSHLIARKKQSLRLNRAVHSHSDL